MKIPKFGKTAARVTTMNLLIAVCILACFLLALSGSNRRIGEEQRLSDESLLDYAAARLADETLRLRKLTDQLAADNEVILLMSGGMDNATTTAYVRRVQLKLLQLKSSVTYVIDAYAYVKSQGKAYASAGIGVEQNVGFLNNSLKNALEPGEYLPNFAAIDARYLVYQSFALYVAPVHHYGSVAVQIDLEEFLSLRRFSADFPGCNLVLLDANGRFFASSYGAADNALRQADFSALQTDSVLALPGGQVTALRRDEVGVDRFTLLLLLDQTQARHASGSLGALTALSVSLLLLFNALFVVLNVRSHHPVTKLAAKYGAARADNEVNYIDTLIDRYSAQAEQMKRRFQTIQLDIALSDLVNAGGRADAAPPARAVSECFDGEFHDYFLVYLCAQDAEGAPDPAAFRIAEDILQAKSAEESPYVRAYVLKDEWTHQGAASALAQGFLQGACRARVRAGVSDWFSGAAAFREALCQARGRMGALSAASEEEFALCMEGAPCAEAGGLTLDEQNQLASRALAGVEGAEIRALLTQNGQATISEMRGNARALALLCQTICRSVGMEAALPGEAALAAGIHAEFIAARLCAGYAEIGRYYAAMKPNAIAEVEAYLRAHYREALTLESIAAAFHLSPPYLSRLFKKANGDNLFSYLSGVRMGEAKRILIEHPEIKVSELAERVGIGNATTFLRQFKAEVGMTPDQYRRAVIYPEERTKKGESGA